MEESAMFGGIAALSGIVGVLSFFVGIIATYIATSYGLSLLAKKYEPGIHPALAWIPVVNIYVYARLSGKSPWWILGLIIPFLNIFVSFYLAYFIAKRAGYDVGMTLLLVFFSCIALPWLGLKVNGRKVTTAWILGIIAFVGTLIGGISLFAALVTAGISAGFNPLVQEQVMEELQNNPEFQQAMQELKDNPEAMKAIEEQIKNNPELQGVYDSVKNITE